MILIPDALEDVKINSSKLHEEVMKEMCAKYKESIQSPLRF